MDSDDARFWIACGPALLAAWAVGRLREDAYLDALGPDGVRPLFYSSLATSWTLMYLGYLVLTVHTYARMDHAALRRRLRTVSRGEGSGALKRWGLAMGSPLSWALSTTLGALGLVVLVMVDPAARTDPWLRGLNVLLVLASWGIVAVAHALAYARTDAQSGGVRFAGTAEPVFGDYLSLSVFVTTLYGEGDAQLSGSRLRSLMRGHVLVAFAFNSMVVASLATLLLTA